MSDRGMKKWAPYKALNVQYESLSNMRNQKERIEKPHMSSDKANEINEILTHYNGEVLTIDIYERGSIKSVDAILKKIDPYNKVLITSENKTIKFQSIVNIVSKSNTMSF